MYEVYEIDTVSEKEFLRKVLFEVAASEKYPLHLLNDIKNVVEKVYTRIYTIDVTIYLDIEAEIGTKKKKGDTYITTWKDYRKKDKKSHLYSCFYDGKLSGIKEIKPKEYYSLKDKAIKEGAYHESSNFKVDHDFIKKEIKKLAGDDVSSHRFPGDTHRCVKYTYDYDIYKAYVFAIPYFTVKVGDSLIYEIPIKPLEIKTNLKEDNEVVAKAKEKNKIFIMFYILTSIFSFLSLVGSLLSFIAIRELIVTLSVYLSGIVLLSGSLVFYDLSKNRIKTILKKEYDDFFKSKKEMLIEKLDKFELDPLEPAELAKLNNKNIEAAVDNFSLPFWIIAINIVLIIVAAFVHVFVYAMY